MENTTHSGRMSSSELANLWSQYLNDSLSHCIIRYFINTVEDKEIGGVLQFALKLSESHLQKIKEFLTKENYPIPKGFTDEDVTLEAPTLFTDTYIIVFMQIMSVHGMTRYAGAIGCAIREDQRKYFKQVISESVELYDLATGVLVSKGIISNPPTFNNHQKVEFVKKQSYLTGWLGKRRPISAIEVSGTYLNMQKTLTKLVLELGFSQVSQSKDVRKYMKRARSVCQEHFKILASMLTDDDLHIPRTFDSEVTDSTVPPFSDKLMMFLISSLLSSAIGYYGEAMSLCQRRDLATNYAKMITDIAVLAEDGINLLIENEWMEQPPLATDHDDLAKNK
ncbi:transcriptional regulator [Bacillus endophyticus]|uniref:DUF3231 family protein n=1 Tax=Priestia endophytica TaxID=135735 RepID=UPI0018CE5A56|nr:DUF3231 family protein [Priestia endophytica]MBG9813912.1 transcriptional regulator [Priestia endophytica]